MKVREMDIEFYRNRMSVLEGQIRPAWQYDEMKHCGVDFSDANLVELYDKRHQAFRDYRKEAETVIGLLGLKGNETVIDMGCGTGAFALYAAKCCTRVYAVDVSKAMLDYANRKAKKAGIRNIRFRRGGFLTYEHRAEPVDAVVSGAALHHLPDFWKLVGLRRLAQMLKAHGRLYLFDVVFSFEIARYESCIAGFIQSMTQQMGPGSRNGLNAHFRQEHSTFGWIMEGLLERAGFAIEKVDCRDGFWAAYLCTKKGE